MWAPCVSFSGLCASSIVPEEGWSGQPKYSTPSKIHSTLYRFLPSYSLFHFWSRLDHYIDPTYTSRIIVPVACFNVLSSIGSRFDQTWVRRLILPGRIQNRRLAFLFVTLQERIDEKVNISRHLCLLLRYGSRFIVKYTKAAKAKLNHRSKLWLQQSAAFHARFTIFTSRASQFRARPSLNRCGFAVYTTSKPYRFETLHFWKRSTFESAYKTTRFRRRVNERRTASKPMRLQMKPRPCKQCLN